MCSDPCKRYTHDAFSRKYNTFDCYIVTTHATTCSLPGRTRGCLLASRPATMKRLLASVRGYRLMSVLGDWKPFEHVI
jgi:hypothetical protein